MKKLTIINWIEILKLTYKICEKIIDSRFNPDVIVGIHRWGIIPALIISDVLNNINVKVLYIKEKPCNINGLKNKKVLLVDEVCDSGKTFKKAIKILKKMKTKEIRTACLHLKPRSIFKPNYVGMKMKNNNWIIYPWSIFESVREKKIDALVIKKIGLENVISKKFYLKIIAE
ncbi:MAG: phosphoribosyltransferase family protein [Candidatus Aenigmatarchaeota archaeon]